MSLHRAGLSNPAIGLELGYGRDHPRTLLSHVGISVKSVTGGAPARKLTPAQEQEAILLYLAGATRKEVGERFSVSSATVANTLHRHGYECRTRGARKFALDPTCFDDITSSSAYWMGFLIADGCVSGPNHRLLTVGLERGDRDHLAKLNAFMGSPQRTIYDAEQVVKDTVCLSSRICVSSRRMTQQLIDRGITPRKSGNARPAQELATFPSFWRGAIDGDGHLSDGDPSLDLAGSRVMCEMFHQFAERALGTEVRFSIRKARNSDSMYRGALFADNAYALIDLLYRDAPRELVLDRKAEAAQRILAKHAHRAGRIIVSSGSESARP